MKRLLKSLVTLLLTVFPTACVYDYDPGVQGSQQDYLVVEGDILAGDYTLIQLSRMSALDAEATPEFITGANVFIQCENSGIFRTAELDYTTFDNPCFRIDTRDLDVNQRCQLVIIVYGGPGRPNVSYSTPWMQVMQTESVLDSLTYVVAPDYSRLDVRIHTHGKAEGYYRWIGKEIWEYSAVFRAIGYYDPTLDDIVLYENGENTYYCWKRDVFRDVAVASPADLGVDHFSDYTIYTTDNRNDRRFGLVHSLELTQVRISREAYNYWTSMRNNTSDVGGLFSPQPSDVRGNIRNMDDSTEYVVGYVSASTTSKAQKYYRNLTGHFGIIGISSEVAVILKRPMWRSYYNNGYLPIVPYIPDVEEPPEDLYGMFEWAPKICVDCRLKGGSKRVPEGWPNPHI